MHFNTIVIGGGAAGLIAAGKTAENGHKVLVLERNNILGKKLFITGKGRCNLTNNDEINNFIARYGKNGRFLYRAFKRFSNTDLITFFTSNGIKIKNERGGRVFPASDKSNDIIKALTRYTHLNNVEIQLNSYVTEIKHIQENSETLFEIFIKGKSSLKCNNVIIATGGLSYPLTGSTGDGYKFAKSFGHDIVKPMPGLVPLVVKESFIKDLQGLALKNVTASIYANNKIIASEFGELLFTHFGLSGPIILTLSGIVSEYLLKGESIEVSINLKPALDKETLKKRLLREFDTSGLKSFSSIVKTLLPSSLVPVFIKLTGIAGDKKANQITKADRDTIQSLLTDFRFKIKGVRSIDEAIVTKGGVSLNEIDPYTMESKKVKGLYFCGEVLDIDGPTGGYNLQAAFSTGYLAGSEVK
ncbi:NAD(P)/FAD-dependent oxidoreductase [Elusimicrobiota bacterium]